jgi:hypothetical protein
VVYIAQTIHYLFTAYAQKSRGFGEFPCPGSDQFTSASMGGFNYNPTIPQSLLCHWTGEDRDDLAINFISGTGFCLERGIVPDTMRSS